MQREEVEIMVNEAVAPVARQLGDFIKSEQESNRVVSTLLARLTAVVAGDKEFKQPGLVDTVASHEKFIMSIQSFQDESRGALKAVKGAVWLGGGIVTLLNLAIQVFFSRG